MNKDDLYAFICEDADLAMADLTDETLLFSDGYIDSFTMTALIAFIEEQAGIAIDQGAVTLENFDTISRIVRFVELRRAA